MESVYFYTEKISKDVTKTLKEDSFMRISYIVRVSPNSEKKGNLLYVEATPEEMKALEERLKDIGAEKITGEDEKTAIKTIKAEEDNAASGMGMIFG